MAYSLLLCSHPLDAVPSSFPYEALQLFSSFLCKLSPFASLRTAYLPLCDTSYSTDVCATQHLLHPTSFSFLPNIQILASLSNPSITDSVLWTVLTLSNEIHLTASTDCTPMRTWVFLNATLPRSAQVLIDASIHVQTIHIRVLLL